MTEEDLLAFVTASIGSVWTLELLLLLKREPGKSWATEELIREMRSSPVVTEEALAGLRTAGLVIQDVPGRHSYQAASEHLDLLVGELEKAYGTRPMTVIKAIVTPPSEKLRTFSDAFKLKD